MKKVLTDRTLKALKPAEPGKRYVVWDAHLHNFGVRVTDKGRRTFIIMRRLPGARLPVRHALGEYPIVELKTARERAQSALETLKQGVHPKDVQAQRDREATRQRKDTFAVVADEFMKRHVSKLRSGREIEAAIRRDLVSQWGERPVTAITRRDMVELLEAIVDRGSPYVAHNALAYARKLFNWAIARDAYGLEASPCDRISARDVIGAKEPRQRVLTDEEIRLIWRATEWHVGGDGQGIGYPFAPFARMLLITGQRLREVAEARWSEFDLNGALWSIPPSRMKGDHAHEVPLPPLAVETLMSLPQFSSGPYVFSTTSGARPISGFAKAKIRIDRLLGKLRSEEGTHTMAEWRFHDLRRTMRTHLSALPVPELVRELVIAHQRPGLHRVYDQHAYRDEKRQALNLWTIQLGSIVSTQ
jgi:integrase